MPTLGRLYRPRTWPDHAHIGRSLRVNKHAWTAH